MTAARAGTSGRDATPDRAGAPDPAAAAGQAAAATAVDAYPRIVAALIRIIGDWTLADDPCAL